MASENIRHNLAAAAFVFLVFVVGIFIVPFGPLSDSAEAMLGGCLMLRGLRPYSSFISQHNPLIYYVTAGIYRVTGTCGVSVPRFIFYAVFIGILLLYRRYTKSYAAPLMLLLAYALLAPHYSYHLVLADTLVVFAALTAVLLITMHKRMSGYAFWLLFTLTQFVFLTANPLFTAVGLVLMVFFIVHRRSGRTALVAATVLPAGLLFLSVNLRDYIQSVIVYNIRYYPGCAGSAWELYRRYFSPLIRGSFTDYRTAAVALEITLAIWLLWQRNAVMILLAGLLFIRPDGFHLGAYTMFGLAWMTVQKKTRTVAAVFVLLLWLGVTNYAAMLRQNDTTADRYRRLVETYSQPGEKIIILPGNAEVYLTTGRLLGTYFTYTGPCMQPGSEDRLIDDIRKNDVRMILIDNGINAFGKGLPETYLKKTISFLQNNPRYSTIPIDAAITIYDYRR